MGLVGAGATGLQGLHSYFNMKRFTISDGTSTNIVVVPDDADQKTWPVKKGSTVTLATDKDVVTKPIIVPEAVTRRQLKEWLLDNDLTQNVEAVVDSLPDTLDGKKVRNSWEESTEFRRDHPLVAAIGVAIGLSSADIDVAFTKANTL